MSELLTPFSYDYMLKAIWVSALVGGLCAFLSCFLILKGWSLMGDALAHAIMPGVAIAYLFGLPFAAGAFFAGLLAALGMRVIHQRSKLREDAIIGIIFTTFFAAGLLIISIFPMSINVQSIVLGNILAISDEDVWQVVLIGTISIAILLLKWKDLTLLFFDESHARSVGINPKALYFLFFVLLAGSTVAALQTVGAILVVAMVITPGATAYLLTDRFQNMLILSVIIGTLTSAIGAYLSYFLDGATGGVIVTLQTLVFLTAFLFAPKHGFLAGRRLQNNAEKQK